MEINRIYDPEVAEKLKAFLPFTSKEFPYVPKVFREYVKDKDLWPIFILKPKSGVQASRLEDQVYATNDEDGQKMHLATGSMRLELLKTGIVNIKNWRDEKGKLIQIKRDGSKVSEDTLHLMSHELQIELQEAITNQATLSDEELEGLEF